jgi:hypothetical protein
LHRFIWDLRFTPLPRSGPEEYPMQAVFHNTAPAPNSPLIMPGKYTLRLMADGKTYTQPLVVKMDPRVKTPLPGLLEQYKLSMSIYDDLGGSLTAVSELDAVRKQIAALKSQGAQGPVAASMAGFDQSAAALQGERAPRFGARNPKPVPDTFNRVNGQLAALMADLQEADVAPTEQLTAAVQDRRDALAKLMGRWSALKKQDLVALNAQLKRAGLAEIAVPTSKPR